MGWKDGWQERRVEGRTSVGVWGTDGWGKARGVERRMEGRKERWVDGQKDRREDGWVDGGKDKKERRKGERWKDGRKGR